MKIVSGANYGAEVNKVSGNRAQKSKTDASKDAAKAKKSDKITLNRDSGTELKKAQIIKENRLAASSASRNKVASEDISKSRDKAKKEITNRPDQAVAVQGKGLSKSKMQDLIM